MVTGDPAAGIQEAWIVYTFDNGGLSGTWRPLELVQDRGDTRLWQGTLNLNGNPAAGLRFIVQAANGVGLVTMMTNQGDYYQPGIDPAAAPEGQLPVTLTLELPAASGFYGSQQAFTAIAAQGTAPIAGLPVKFNLGGQGRLAVTGNDGRASVNFFLVAQPGEYSLEAAFDGNTAYAAAAVSRAFTIEPGTTSLMLTPKLLVVLPGASAEFSATLTSEGLPLAGKSVALTVDAVGVKKFTSVAVSDYAGRVSWQVPGQSAGSYQVKAWFGLPVTAELDLSSRYYAGSYDTAALVNQFTFGGFFQPVANPPVANKVNAGSAVPVKFSLGGNFGLNIFAKGYPNLVKATCQAKYINPIEKKVNAVVSSLSYDPLTGQYTYTWKTDKKWAGTCGSLVMKFIDGTQKTALFQFTK
jgi:hypothetical protein